MIGSIDAEKSFERFHSFLTLFKWTFWIIVIIIIGVILYGVPKMLSGRSPDWISYFVYGVPAVFFIVGGALSLVFDQRNFVIKYENPLGADLYVLFRGNELTAMSHDKKWERLVGRSVPLISNWQFKTGFEDRDTGVQREFTLDVKFPEPLEVLKLRINKNAHFRPDVYREWAEAEEQRYRLVFESVVDGYTKQTRAPEFILKQVYEAIVSDDSLFFNTIRPGLSSVGVVTQLSCRVIEKPVVTDFSYSRD